jgi:hypothetical protein
VPSDAASSGDPPVRALAYRLTPADAAAFAALRPRWSARRWWLLPVAAGIVGTLWPLLQDSVGVAEGDPRGWFVVVALTLLVVLSGAAADQADRRRRAAQLPLPRGAVRTEVTADGIVVEADGLRRAVAWTAIGAVDVGPAHVFVRTTPDDGIILPLRAFASRAEMETFGDWVDRRSAEATD